MPTPTHPPLVIYLKRIVILKRDDVFEDFYEQFRRLDCSRAKIAAATKKWPTKL